MAVYFLMYNVGNVYNGRTETSRSFSSLEKAKKEAKKLSRELGRGVRIYKDIGLYSNDEYTPTK